MSEKKRINLFVERLADRDCTNAQSVTSKEVVTRLDPQRFHVTMLSRETPDSRIATRLQTRFLPYRRHGNTLNILRHVAFSPPDIYFFPGDEPLASAYRTLRRTLKMRTKLIVYVVCSLRGLKNPPPGIRNTEHWCRYYRTLSAQIRDADIVVGNSHYISAEIRSLFGLQASTVHSGIDRSIFSPKEKTSIRSNERTVLYVGSFQSRKRPEVVVRSAANWPNVKFRMIGDGEERGACEALARNIGAHNVSFLGHLPQARLAEEMQQADLFFFPSILEGNPQVLGQVTACGVPSIAMSDYQPDYVVHGKTGFLADTDGELEKYLEILLTDDARRDSMSKAALRHAAEFDWDAVAAKWSSIFEFALRGRNS